MTPHCAQGFFYHSWRRSNEGLYICARCLTTALVQGTALYEKLEDVLSESALLALGLLADPRFRYEPPDLAVAALALLVGSLAGLEGLLQVFLPQ